MNCDSRFHRNSEHIGSDVTPFCLFGGLFPALQTDSSYGPLNYSLSGHPQVAQGKQCYQLRRVLGQPLVANLGKTKLALDDPEGVFHLAGQSGIDGGEQLQAQVVGFERMAKSQNSAFVRQACSPRVKSCKFTVQRRVVQRFFHGRVRQAIELLQDVDAQHGLHGKRGASAFGARTAGREGLNQTHQRCPGHYHVHLGEQHAFARALGDKLESGGGKADLFHNRLTSRHLIRCQGFAEYP